MQAGLKHLQNLSRLSIVLCARGWLSSCILLCPGTAFRFPTGLMPRLRYYRLLERGTFWRHLSVQFPLETSLNVSHLFDQALVGHNSRNGKRNKISPLPQSNSFMMVQLSDPLVTQHTHDSYVLNIYCTPTVTVISFLTNVMKQPQTMVVYKNK